MRIHADRLVFDSHRHVVSRDGTSFFSDREVSPVPVERRRGSALRNILHYWAEKNGEGGNATLLAHNLLEVRAQSY